MYLRPIVCAFLLSLSACSIEAGPVALANSSVSSRTCRMAEADELWLQQSISAWNYALEHLAQAKVERLTAVIFDGRCRLASETAMTGGAAEWSSTGHDGSVLLPDGNGLPAQVTSFAAPAGDGAFFVMAAPSVWRAGGVQAGGLTLEKLMTAVLLHEGSHVLQFPTYGEAMGELTKRHALPDTFNDDSIQSRFEADREFAASVARETELMFAAAAAPDLQEARRLAREARALMLSRHGRWFVGQDAHLRAAEDIWLTMEGSGQWLAYRWLTDPRGGGIPEALALEAFAKRGKWWSQKQGVALFLALDRLAPPGWKARVFGGTSDTASEILDTAAHAEGTYGESLAGHPPT